MYSKGDFHIHSYASDGKLSSKEIILIAKNSDIDIISITDHDNTNSIEDGLVEADKNNIKLIPGIELSTIYKKESIHILGYFKNDMYKEQAFQNELSLIATHRQIRAKEMVLKLHEFFNIDIDFEKIYNDSKGVLARPHIAKAIIEAGYPYGWEYIFNNIIDKKSPAYVSNKRITLADGIKLLKSFGALVVLAHPVLIKNSSINELIKFDFDGIEAIYPLNTVGDTKKYIEIAEINKKFITAGSDFHGLGNIDSTHGIMGEVYLQGHYLKSFLHHLGI